MRSVVYNGFKSIEDFKSRAEFFKKGSILPRRILSVRGARGCDVVIGSNQYAIPTPRGYIVFVENHDGEYDCVIRIKRPISKLIINCSIYSSGKTYWIGNNPGCALDSINEKYKALCGG